MSIIFYAIALVFCAFQEKSKRKYGLVDISFFENMFTIYKLVLNFIKMYKIKFVIILAKNNSTTGNIRNDVI